MPSAMSHGTIPTLLFLIELGVDDFVFRLMTGAPMCERPYWSPAARLPVVADAAWRCCIIAWLACWRSSIARLMAFGAFPFTATFTCTMALRTAAVSADMSDLKEFREIAGAGDITCNHVLYHLQERAPKATIA